MLGFAMVGLACAFHERNLFTIKGLSCKSHNAAMWEGMISIRGLLGSGSSSKTFPATHDDAQ
jgi:hypothetical protein